MLCLIPRYLPTLLLGAARLAHALTIPSAASSSASSGDASSSRNDTAGGIFKRSASYNWCGPVNFGSGITSVEATWAVPKVSLPRGGWPSHDYHFYQWVGLDGTKGCGALLQGGTGQTIENGHVSYYTWFEFWPSPPVYGHVEISPGDTVHVRVNATSAESGRIYFENKSTRERYTEVVKSSGASLCFATAEWIGENPSIPPGQFPAFSQYDFTGCRAQTSSGAVLGLPGADDWIMFRGEERLCHPERRGDLTTSIIYG
ncbi:Concanavalin A-like lectin/glucanase [Metarhizium album ARSEF 1941]|uniref:Concanavalin A-like lectin/glucanase n=1 Tax=Metarhizium album (strain ARSEF 1941) TaxID=1081103 RepID=A0A0B2WWE1_METAS|nr:Concanavalin A-like lectin/glucanase [Metarhizium album ARSEF 1941]KHN97924.1 Concanavalin A-like lectin/glucanase [Metarhizium album ARSEF 1941]